MVGRRRVREEGKWERVIKEDHKNMNIIERRDGRIHTLILIFKKPQPTTCPLFLAIYVALARSIEAFTSSLCQSPSASLVQPAIMEVEAERLSEPGNVKVVGDV